MSSARSTKQAHLMLQLLCGMQLQLQPLLQKTLSP